MALMSKHAAPSLRLAQVPDSITVLAGAMRAFADQPGSPEARRDLDAAMRGCTDEEYEAAWDMAQQGQPAAAPPEAPPESPAPSRARVLTKGQAWLAGAAVALELALAPVFFAVMFVTVNGMLAASFKWWAWAVPVSTEITFVLLLVLAVLFEWMRRPVPVLWKLPYLFMGLSSFMNVWAGRGSVADLAGHLAVTAAFFIPMGFAKTTVRKLIVTAEERARAQSLADARAHAYDVLRAAFGVLWRYRTPALLRRQLRSGRLPAAVMTAVETCDAGTWEPVVQAWITAAVTLPGQVGKSLRAASAAASARHEPDSSRPVADKPADSGPDNREDGRADKVTDKPADRLADSGPDTVTDSPADSPADKGRDTVTDISPDKRATRTSARAAKTGKPVHPVAAMIKRRPTWDDEKIAAELDVHPRTVKRHREALAAAANSA